MKAILEFNLPEDQEDFEHAQHGVDYMLTLSDLSDWLRSLVKYQNQTEIKVDEVREKLYQLLLERDLKI